MAKRICIQTHHTKIPKTTHLAHRGTWSSQLSQPCHLPTRQLSFPEPPRLGRAIYKCTNWTRQSDPLIQTMTSETALYELASSGENMELRPTAYCVAIVALLVLGATFSALCPIAHIVFVFLPSLIPLFCLCSTILAQIDFISPSCTTNIVLFLKLGLDNMCVARFIDHSMCTHQQR